MTDDEILAVANEVLIPSGIDGARVMRSPKAYGDGIQYVALVVRSPVEPPEPNGAAFYSVIVTDPANKRPEPTASSVRELAQDMVANIVKTTALWPTPWTPAQAADEAVTP